MMWDLMSFVVFGSLQMLLSFLPLPDPTTLALVDSSLGSFRAYMASVNWFFPVSTFFALLSAIFLIEAGLLSYKLSKWIITNISLGLVKK